MPRPRNYKPQRVELTGTEWEVILNALGEFAETQKDDADEYAYLRSIEVKLSEEVSFNGTVIVTEL